MFLVWSARRGIAVSPLADFTPSPNNQTKSFSGGCCIKSEHFPKGPKIEKNKSRLKISISLENFNLD